MNILEARRRLLDGEIKKRTAEGENISVRSVSRMRPALTLYGKSEQETTTGAQLYDSNLSEDNKYQNFDISTGNFEISNNGSYWITGKIPVEPNTQYILRPSTGSGGAFYSDLETPIKNVSASGNIFTTPENANYVCFNMHRESTPYGTKLMLNKGTTALPWEPYTGGQPSPSPDYPQEIKSVGDSGTVNVTLSNGGSQSQTLPVQTPNGLPGIPVSSGGNYTDANGQQWVCDEVDFKRGVYVQRVKKTSNITWILHNVYTIEDSELFKAVNITDGLQRGISENQELSSKLIKDITILNYNKSGFYQSYGSIFARIKGVSELDEFKQLMADAEFLYCLETPIETSLSPSELAAYAALRTYSPTTVVTNDAGAWMKLGYKTKNLWR